MEWKLDDLRNPTAKRLYALNVQPNTDSFWVLHTAVLTLRDDPSMLVGTTKVLYPKVARAVKSTPMAVQDQLRRTVKRIWAAEESRALLAPYLPGDRCPTSAQFLAALLRWEAECIEADRAER